MGSIRFLQLSDVHFGQTMRGGKLRVPAAVAAERVQERRDCFARAIGLVQRHELDGVVVPGDLFDHESVDSDTLRFVIHTLGAIAPRPVFIAPGNHDPWAGASAYAAQDAGNVRGLTWPDNVHVFAHDDFRTVPWPGREDVSVTGSGVAFDRPSAERRLGGRVPGERAGLSILLFHGSRDDSGFLQASKSTYPFSSEELLAQDFTWTALGHYHAHQLIQDPAGRPRAAYSGCLTAGGLDEGGPKGVLLVEIHGDRTSVEFLRLDPREVQDLECDLTGATHAEVARERLERALADVPADDLVRVRLVGRRTARLDLDWLDRFARDRFHLAIDSSGLRPDLDLEDWPAEDEARTIEERFVARMKALGESGDPALARRAMLYGLDALQQARLDLRYED
jgi:DNA repair exonuclease SbcCD nuclease subunit